MEACKASTGVGAGCFHPKMQLDFSAEMCGKIMVFLAEVTQCGCWPVQASTLLSSLLLMPKNVTSEKIYCLAAHSMVGVAESASGTRMEEKRLGEMGRYGRKQWRIRKNSVGSFAGHGQVQLQCGRYGPRSSCQVCGFELQFEVVGAYAMHFGFPQRTQSFNYL